MESYSERARNAGNMFYKRFDEKGFPVINKQNLNNAVICYEDALRIANNMEESYKASKNLGLAYERMISLCKLDLLKDEKTFDNYYYLLKMLFKSSVLCLIYGNKYLSIENFIVQTERIESTILKHFEILKGEGKYSCIYYLIQLTKKYLPLYLYLSSVLIRYYFIEAFYYYEQEFYIKSKINLNEAINLYNTIYNTDNIEQMDERTKDTFDDVYQSCIFYKRRIEIKKLLEQSEEFLIKAIGIKNEIDLDYGLLCLDYCRDAIKLLTDNKDNREVADIESEAICLYKMGKIYYSILKNRDKGYKLVMESISMGLSLYPKNISSEQWYIKATNLAQRIREEKIMLEDKSKMQIKQDYKEKNKTIFDEIKAKAINSLEFAKFILEKYPYPGLELINVDTCYSNNPKNFIKKLCVKYHPDKWPKTTVEELNKSFIIEEISSILNAFYDSFKNTK